tara:strand:- start:32 stop:277 length:246 start_codon:yes stop_codon:yes gene_type:complete
MLPPVSVLEPATWKKVIVVDPLCLAPVITCVPNIGRRLEAFIPVPNVKISANDSDIENGTLPTKKIEEAVGPEFHVSDPSL